VKKATVVQLVYAIDILKENEKVKCSGTCDGLSLCKKAGQRLTLLSHVLRSNSRLVLGRKEVEQRRGEESSEIGGRRRREYI